MSEHRRIEPLDEPSTVHVQFPNGAQEILPEQDVRRSVIGGNVARVGLATVPVIILSETHTRQSAQAA